jgi:hypothetical protein
MGETGGGSPGVSYVCLRVLGSDAGRADMAVDMSAHQAPASLAPYLTDLLPARLSSGCVSVCVSCPPPGITLDVVLVTLICPKAVIGGKAPAAAGQSALAKWLATVPAAALEANVKGEAGWLWGSPLCACCKFSKLRMS